jgi:peptide/nickel transport system permease protein
MYVHILPNVFNTFVVIATLQMSQFVLTEASLSFLGAGVPPPTPSWGNMISDGLQYIQTAWWMSLVPGIALVLMVLAMNLLGDWLRDVLDPKLRQT